MLKTIYSPICEIDELSRDDNRITEPNKLNEQLSDQQIKDTIGITE